MKLQPVGQAERRDWNSGGEMTLFTFILHVGRGLAGKLKGNPLSEKQSQTRRCVDQSNDWNRLPTDTVGINLRAKRHRNPQQCKVGYLFALFCSDGEFSHWPPTHPSTGPPTLDSLLSYSPFNPKPKLLCLRNATWCTGTRPRQHATPLRDIIEVNHMCRCQNPQSTAAV